MFTEIDRANSCSFTGHRPERLILPELIVLRYLQDEIARSVDLGFRVFISGMQRGVDIWAAEEVLRQKQLGANIDLIAACAWKGMEDDWDPGWVDRYNKILDKATEICYIGSKPGRQAFIARDHWMVDHSSRLIGVYNGVGGGTKETLDYARKMGITTIVLDEFGIRTEA